MVTHLKVIGSLISAENALKMQFVGAVVETEGWKCKRN